MTTRAAGAGAGSGIQSIHRALDALEVVGRSPGIGVTALSKQMGVAVSTAHGIVATLADRSYLLHGAQGYELGPAVVALAGRWSPARSLGMVLEQAMTELSESTGMASTATILDGEVAQIVAYAPAPGPITVRGGARRRNPLELATGRLLVALGDAGGWAHYLRSFAGVEPGWNRARWQRELVRIRSVGVALKTTRDPRLEVSLAVPVLGAGDTVVCAIGCSVPSFVAADLFQPRVLARILDTSERVTAALGGVPGPRPVVDFPAAVPYLAADSSRATRTMTTTTGA
jgi:DNA-binding IclR family transcriptional regulator